MTGNTLLRFDGNNEPWLTFLWTGTHKKEDAMFAKKTLCMLSAGTMLAAAAPAFADRGDDYRWRGRAVAERPVFVERQAVQGASQGRGA